MQIPNKILGGRKMKKLITLLLCLAMTVAMLSGCAQPQAPAAAPAPAAADPTAAPAEATKAPAAEKIQLKLGIWPEDSLVDDVKMHEGFVKKFNEIHPNIEIVPSYYKYQVDTFVPLAESGNLPELFDTWYTEPQKLIAGGYVADITDILQERGWLDAMNPTIKELLSKDGRVYGIPRDGYALGLMINIEQFEAAGLVDDKGYPLYPKTWEELAQTAKIIKDKTGEGGICILAKDLNGGWHFSNIAWCFGATLTTVENGKYTAHVNSPEAIAAMQYVKDLKWVYDVLTADPMSEDWGTGFVSLGTGAAAMLIAANDAVNQPTQINGLPADKLAIVPMPKGPGGKQFSLSGGTPYMFSKNATREQIEAALDYIEIMGKAPTATEDSIAGMKSDYTNKKNAGCPVIPRFPAWIDPKLVAAEDAIIKELNNVDMALFNDYYNILKTPGNLHLEEPGMTQDLYGELTKVLQAVITDKNADVTTLMNTAQTNYQAILDDKLNK